MSVFTNRSSFTVLSLLLMLLFFAVIRKPAAGIEPRPNDVLHAAVPDRARTQLQQRFSLDQGRTRIRKTGANEEDTPEKAEKNEQKRVDAEDALPRWSVFAYRGRWSDNRFVQILAGSTELESSYLWAAGVSRTFMRLLPNLYVEGETHVALHSGEQDHLELNAFPSLRWTRFPWDHVVDTSTAFGLGGSIATEKPEVETRSDKEASKYLFYMMGEVAFELVETDTTAWEGFLRIHHRSGGFETVINAEGSNFISLGLRYRFGGQ